ncbi:MAG TPA: FtsX-like permease family protein [Candidatus Sulfotelmatobacter sp.]|nr:FtsX-like permease family protein [Candidatus Sulfotelmatobacter sp.]
MPGGSLVRLLPGLARTIVRRAGADLPFMLAVWLLLTSGVTLVASSVLYGETVALGGIRRSLEAAPAADRGVQVETSSPAGGVAGLDGAVRPLLESALGSGGSVTLALRSPSYSIVGAPGTPLVVLGGYADLESHAQLVEGSWPTPGRQPLDATISQGAAASLHLHVGDSLGLADASTPGASPAVAVASARIVGIWKTDPQDPYWLGDTLDASGADSNGVAPLHGPLFVSPDDLLHTPATVLDVRWRGTPGPAALRPETIGDLRARLATLPSAVLAAAPVGHYVQVSNGLANVLGSIAAAGVANGTNVLLLVLQYAVLAAYAVLLVAAMLSDRRRTELALLRSRGASTFDLLVLAIGEALLLAVPAVLVACAASVAIVLALGSVGPLAAAHLTDDVQLDAAPVWAAVGAAAAGIVVLAAPVLAGGRHLASVRGAMARPLARTLAQRLGLDLALVVVAAIALWQLRTYGAPLTADARGALGVDPLLVAAPAFGLIAGGVLATRLVPRLAELAERLLVRRRGLVAPMGARQLARRPLRYTRAALLLVLACALVVFAAVYAATWTRSQEDQAAYQAASDLRLVATPTARLPDWAAGDAIRALPGVVRAMPVERQTFSASGTIRDGAMLAVEPDLAATMLSPAATGGRDPGPALAALVKARPASQGVALAGQPTVLQLTVHLTQARSEEGMSEPVDLQVILRDADGRLFRVLPDATVPFDVTQTVDVPLTGTLSDRQLRPAYPLVLEAVQVTSMGFYIDGQATLERVQTLAGASTVPVPVALEPAATTVALTSAPDGSQVTTALWFAPEVAGTPMAAVVDQAFLDLTGAHVGDHVPVSTNGGMLVSLDVVGVAPLFAPLDPANPFVVVDEPTLDLQRLLMTQDIGTTAEWWLQVAPGQAAPLTATLAGQPFTAQQVIGRDALAHTLLTDPVALGTVGALVLGALAAIAFAAIGFLVSAAVSIAERTGELALLRALGLSARQLRAWLSLEHAALLLLGLASGSLLGLLMAWLVLPFTTLGPGGAASVPPPVVDVPWTVLGAVVVLAIALLAAALAIVGRTLPRIRLATVLRSGE